MAKVKQKVYLMTEQQRDALLNYLLNKPYREVAGGVQFLTNAPTTVLNLEVPDEEYVEMSNDQEVKLESNSEETSAASNSIEEEFAVLSRS